MTHTTVLGVGNTVLSDEGLGPRLAAFMEASPDGPKGVSYVDGGTIGLALLPLMEEAESLVVLDAALLDAEPGTIRVFEGTDMDAFLRTRGRSPHDVGLDDLMDALRLRDRLPKQRALVAVQPAVLTLGDGLTSAVEAALPQAAEAAWSIIRQWKGQVTS